MRKRMNLLVVALCAAILLTACGSSSSSSSGSVASGSAPSGGSATSSSSSAARVALATCMRSHGVDVPDPGPNGPTPGAMQRLQQQYSPAQLNPALTACRSQLATAFPQIDFSPAAQAQRRQQAVQFAQCMRAHGVDIPDPSSTGSGLGLGLGLWLPEHWRFGSDIRNQIANVRPALAWRRSRRGACYRPGPR